MWMLRIENLKVGILKIKLLMVWSLLQLIIIFSSMLLENLWMDSQSLCSQCRSVHSFQTFLLAANFGCYQIKIMTAIISRLLHTAIWSGCAFLLEQNRPPFLGPFSWTGSQCTGFNSEPMHLFLCIIFTQRPTNDFAMAFKFNLQNSLIFHIAFIIQKLWGIETILTLELSKNSKSGSSCS